MQSQTKAYLYASLAVAAWSTVASAFKIALRHVTPDQLILYSAGTAMLILLIAAGAQGKLRELRTFTGRDWARSALAGLLNPFLYYVVLFRAFDLFMGCREKTYEIKANEAKRRVYLLERAAGVR